MEFLLPYHSTGVALGVVGALLLLQLLVADIAGIKASHKPGMPVAADHNSFLFRASRSLANMNESVAIFIIFAVVGMLSQSNPVWLGRWALLYVAARSAYMLCYWFNIKAARSVCFGFAFLGLIGMGVVMAGGLIH
jgi:uncharacterized MAPEG superfamily protein